MKSFQDYALFNSVNPTATEPKPRKAMPFPLENIDQEIADTYDLLKRLTAKLKTAQENPVTDSKAQQKRLESLQYKTKTCMKLIKEVSLQVQDLWF
jgi:hypothetical protein